MSLALSTDIGEIRKNVLVVFLVEKSHLRKTYTLQSGHVSIRSVVLFDLWPTSSGILYWIEHLEINNKLLFYDFDLIFVFIVQILFEFRIVENMTEVLVYILYKQYRSTIIKSLTIFFRYKIHFLFQPKEHYAIKMLGMIYDQPLLLWNSVMIYMKIQTLSFSMLQLYVCVCIYIYIYIYIIYTHEGGLGCS